ncbi:hypothetical protein [Planctomycetes bacterium Poly30]|uniref:hypothetical protein n=1 Tax=Saltatorellus ferox TaxID=2528018 RepID=UPI0011A0A443
MKAWHSGALRGTTGEDGRLSVEQPTNAPIYLFHPQYCLREISARGSEGRYGEEVVVLDDLQSVTVSVNSAETFGLAIKVPEGHPVAGVYGNWQAIKDFNIRLPAADDDGDLYFDSWELKEGRSTILLPLPAPRAVQLGAFPQLSLVDAFGRVISMADGRPIDDSNVLYDFQTENAFLGSITISPAVAVSDPLLSLRPTRSDGVRIYGSLDFTGTLTLLLSPDPITFNVFSADTLCATVCFDGSSLKQISLPNPK